MEERKRLSSRADREAIAAILTRRLQDEGDAASIDTIKCLSYLNEAAASGSVKLFSSYISWFRCQKSPDGHSLRNCLNILRLIISESIEHDDLPAILRPIDTALAELAHNTELSACLIPAESPHTGLATSYLSALLAGNRREAQRLVYEGLEHISIRDLYLSVFQPVQREVGRLWQINKISVAEEHFCTAATQSIMIDLYPRIISSQRIGKTVVAACVGSELHEIGIRMVVDFFEMAGWDTYYLGAGVRREDLIMAIDERKADLVALSATMTYHVENVRNLVAEIRDASPRTSLKIMVGGLPFNNVPNLWREVGADLWATDAEQALQCIQNSDHRE